MPSPVELSFNLHPTKIEPGVNDFEVKFSGDGSLTKRYKDGRGFDMLRRSLRGEMGINADVPADSAPVFWIETAEPEEAHLARDASLTDVISFSDESLLRKLIRENVSKLLDRTE